ncbi:hypothetical protein ACFYOV_16390 [Streptomyces sp. NPDC005931]|uniref:Rv1733c family protein n=1 Tax=Streptomyces sp. NPDC005931 TaxID=3364737 RepID=UPI0036B08DC2
MARTHGARPRAVRLWRWRKNPLRRRSDLVEAWVGLATLVLTLVLGGFAGLSAAGTVEDSIAERRAQSRPVTAALTEDAAQALPSPVTEEGTVWAAVRWTAPDGTPRTGRAEVASGGAEGSSVTVWTDPAGNLVTKPLGTGEARFQTVMAGITVAVAAGGAVVLTGRLVRARMQRRRWAEWEAEWQLVEPSWRKRMTG